MVTHLEPDILECEVKWALGSITTNKASGSYGIPAELFPILKDGAVKVLNLICQQIWKTQQWPQDWNRSVSIPVSKKGNAKECSAQLYSSLWLLDHSKLWKILKETGVPDQLTCPLGNLYAGWEATVSSRHGTADWFTIGKGVWQDCILSLCLFNVCAEHVMWNVRLDESQDGIKMAGSYINKLSCSDGNKFACNAGDPGSIPTHSSILTWEIPWTEEPGGLESMGCKESNMIEAADTFTFQIRRWYHPNDRKWRGTEEPLDEGERGEWKGWLKLNIQKTKIMASSPITSWQNRMGKSGNSNRLNFLELQNHWG